MDDVGGVGGSTVLFSYSASFCPSLWDNTKIRDKQLEEMGAGFTGA